MDSSEESAAWTELIEGECDSSLRSLLAVCELLTKSVLLAGSLAGLASGLALDGGGAALLLLLVGLLALGTSTAHTAESALSLVEETVHC